MSEELMPCPFCGKPPKHGPTKKQYCQLHGEPFQHYAIWCEGHARIVLPSRASATCEWNQRDGIPAATLRGLRDGSLVAVPAGNIADLLHELDASDGYARSENTSSVPSVWQIKNGLLRETITAMLAAAQEPPREVLLSLLEKISAAYGTDAYRQKDRAPVTNPRAMPIIEQAEAAGLLTIDRSELPMMMCGPLVTVVPYGCFVTLTDVGRAMLAARIVPEVADGG